MHHVTQGHTRACDGHCMYVSADKMEVNITTKIRLVYACIHIHIHIVNIAIKIRYLASITIQICIYTYTENVPTFTFG